MRAKLALCLLLIARAALAGEITGRIMLDNKPVAGVTVSALAVEQPADFARREARREPRPAALAKSVTDAKGGFRITFENPDGKAGVLVSFAYSGSGVAESWGPGRLDTSDAEDVGEIAARKGFPLSGRVMDAEGRPVPDAEVEHPTGPGSARTGADGRFTLEGVAEAGNEVVAKKPGFVTAKASGLRGGRTDVSIVLRPALPLAGLVLAADGAPVPNAVVRADGGEFRASAEADAEGRFRIAAFGPGRVSLLADGGERGVREATGVALPRPDDQELRLVLAPPRVFTGRVVDAATRRPVPGAVVDVLAGKLRVWARSGADGAFTLRPAPNGDLRLSSSAPRYVPAVRQVAHTEIGGKPVEVLLRPAATLSGRVTDEQRRPVAGAKVQAWDPEVRTNLAPPPMTRTADDGSFTLRRVGASETLRVAATHPDFEPFAAGDLGVKPGDTRSGLALTLRRGAVITGIVTAGGEPLAGVQMNVSPGRSSFGTPPRSLAQPQWSWPRATTGADGRFRIDGLSPGDYTLRATRTGWAAETRDALVAEGRGPEAFAIALEPEAVVSGRVVGKKGGGVPGQNVSAQSVETGPGSSAGNRSGADGSFRLEGLKKGVAYNVFIYGSGSNAPKATVTPPAEGIELVAIGAGRLAGRAVDPDGRPVTDYQVTAQGDRSASSSGWVTSVRQDVSSESGEFALENVPAALLEVRVVAKGYQVARVGGIALEEGESRSGIEVRLARGAILKGRVVEARGGAPVSGADVSAESTPSRATADSDGAFEFEGLAAGKVRVTAMSPDFVSTTETVEVGEAGGTVELKLSPGASISAAVVSPGGEPVPGAEVSLAQGGQGRSGTRGVTGADGRVRFPHLIPGRFTLTAGSAGQRSKPVDVALEADQARDDVRIVMGGGATVLVTVTGLSPEDRKQLEVGLAGAATYVPAKEREDGRFEARNVASGDLQAFARVGAFGGANARFVSRPVTVPDAGSVDVEVPFESGFSITVHVLKDGQGVEGANVFAAPVAGDATSFGVGTTDASGNTRITGLKGGAYRVRAFASSSYAPEQKIDLEGDQALEIVFPSGSVAGRVVASGTQQPLADAHVSIRSMNADGTFGITHDATTDDGGRFRLDGLAAGPLTVTTTRNGYVVDTRPVTADSPDDVVIELARGDGLDVTGRDGLLGTPLAAFFVRVVDAGGAEVVGSTVRLDSAGRGEIPSLKPGTYAIVASASGLATVAYDGVSVPGPALAVVLTPGGTLDIDAPAEKLKGGPLACVVTGPRGRLAFRSWGNRGALSLSTSSAQLTNFPPVAGTLTCPGSAPIPFVVAEGGSTRIAVK